MVIEWDHGVMLLEPFNVIHKGIFAASLVFISGGFHNVNVIAPYVAVQHKHGSGLER